MKFRFLSWRTNNKKKTYLVLIDKNVFCNLKKEGILHRLLYYDYDRLHQIEIQHALMPVKIYTSIFNATVILKENNFKKEKKKQYSFC